MENSNKLLFVIGMLTLLAVAFSHLSLKTAIEAQTGGELLTASGPTITMSGRGDEITFTSGGGNCTSTSPIIKAEASIVGGAAGSSITVKAKCALSDWSATTTSTDTGGAAVYSSNTAVGGNGAASCTPKYAGRGAPDSVWTAVCSF
ncbi:hypothetical protein RS130_22015 [Paraglaciecola aquimarina]|uniref:Uncharacterized protein n=1 Tax=Paraglaciecola aquimarina TaxID=1235557 RepID=A0ABU3T1P7_9ALTE|nr:hypothetical protein [Paraglaciecola aquimarina]MDU0356199.1 hypothetical protein [Paraglaciecola aquimarina]